MPKPPPTPEELQALADAPLVTPTLAPWIDPAPSVCPMCQEVGPLEYQAQDDQGDLISICGACWGHCWDAMDAGLL